MIGTSEFLLKTLNHTARNTYNIYLPNRFCLYFAHQLTCWWAINILFFSFFRIKFYQSQAVLENHSFYIFVRNHFTFSSKSVVQHFFFIFIHVTDCCFVYFFAIALKNIFLTPAFLTFWYLLLVYGLVWSVFLKKLS